MSGSRFFQRGLGRGMDMGGRSSRGDVGGAMNRQLDYDRQADLQQNIHREQIEVSEPNLGSAAMLEGAPIRLGTGAAASSVLGSGSRRTIARGIMSEMGDNAEVKVANRQYTNADTTSAGNTAVSIFGNLARGNLVRNQFLNKTLKLIYVEARYNIFQTGETNPSTTANYFNGRFIGYQYLSTSSITNANLFGTSVSGTASTAHPTVAPLTCKYKDELLIGWDFNACDSCYQASSGLAAVAPACQRVYWCKVYGDKLLPVTMDPTNADIVSNDFKIVEFFSSGDGNNTIIGTSAAFTDNLSFNTKRK